MDYIPRWFPFHHALCSEHTTTAHIFLNRGAPMQMAYESDNHEEFGHGPTFLHCAAARGMEDIMRRALEIDPSLMAKKTRDSPLTYASECWDSEGVIRLLVEGGADLEEADKSNTHLPSLPPENFSTAWHLLRAGARVEMNSSEKSHLMPFFRRAIQEEFVPQSVYIKAMPPKEVQDRMQLAFLRALLEEGGQVVNPPRKAGWFDEHGTPLLWVLESWCGEKDRARNSVKADIVDMLLKAGTDPNVENPLGNTPLLLAVAYFYDERSPKLSLEKVHARRVISALVFHGARFEMSNCWGTTPLSLVTRYSNRDHGHAPNLYEYYVRVRGPNRYRLTIAD
ncbi:hypothetical protein SLS62_003016 [Diatrype stigma]|uniref:Uncharacterized protein n=1 Tax=Diatrype stigma TaxID=117547 RepID=A0AAN9UX61_9PEZI